MRTALDYEGRGVKRRTAERAQFLAEASALLTTSLDWETTLRNVANLVVPRLADWCAVDMIDGGVIRRVAFAHPDPTKVELGRKLARRYPANPDGPHPLMRVLRGGPAELYPEIPDALIASLAHDDEHLRIVRELGLRSALVVPLRARGRTLGALSFVCAESGRRYGPDDLALAEELAQRAALAVDNARLYRDAQQAHQRFRDLVDGLDAIIWEADPDTWHFTFVSQQAVALLGYPVDRWLGTRDFWASLLVPEDRDTTLRRFEACALGGQDHVLEYRAVAADGRVLWLRDIVRVVRDANGAVRQLRGVIVDVTEAKRAEAAEQHAEALRYVARLANTAAHDINNPLTVIAANLDLVLSSEGLDADTRASLAMAQRAAERIQDIVVNMKRVTRIDPIEGSTNVPEMLALRPPDGPDGAAPAR